MVQVRTKRLEKSCRSVAMVGEAPEWCKRLIKWRGESISVSSEKKNT